MNKQNLEWFEKRCNDAGLEKPSHRACDKFVDRAHSMSHDKTNNQSVDIIREFIYSCHLWGALAEVPKMIVR